MRPRWIAVAGISLAAGALSCQRQAAPKRDSVRLTNEPRPHDPGAGSGVLRGAEAAQPIGGGTEQPSASTAAANTVPGALAQIVAGSTAASADSAGASHAAAPVDAAIGRDSPPASRSAGGVASAGATDSGLGPAPTTSAGVGARASHEDRADSSTSAAPSAPLVHTPAATPSPEENAVRFAAIGDFGDGSHNEAAVARLVRGFHPDFVITTGDDNYPMGQASTIDAHIGAFYADFIGNYHGQFGPGASSNRFWPTPGNHDWYAPGLMPYLEYFTLPGNERYYDVEHGIVHLFALDSDPNEPDGTTADSIQGRWLHARLAASTHCYKVVYFHHPPFSSGPHGDAPAMQWPFRAWGVDVVLTGHDHVYERFQIDGIPYFVNGLGGADRYPMAGPTKPGSIARYNRAHGAMLVMATAEGITYEFWNVDGMKIDELKVPKHCSAKAR